MTHVVRMIMIAENDEDDYHLAVSLDHRAQECLYSAFEAAFLMIINVSEEDIILRCYHQILY